MFSWIVLPITMVFILLNGAFSSPSAQTTSLEPITLDNADRIQQLGALSRGSAEGLSWSPDSNVMAVTTSLGAWLYDLRYQNLSPQPVEGHVGSPNIVYSPNNDIFISNDCPYWHCREQAIRVWTVSTGREKAALLHGYEMGSVVFSPDGNLFAIGDRFGAIRIWETSTFLSLDDLEPLDLDDAKYLFWQGQQEESVGNIVFNGDGKLLATAARGTGDMMSPDAFPIYVWDTASGKLLSKLEGHKEADLALTFSPDNRFLVSRDYADQIYVWDIGQQSPLIETQGKLTFFSPDGQSLVVMDEAIHIWSLETATEQQTLPGGNAVFNNDGSFLLIGADDGTISFLDTEAYQVSRVLEGHQAKIIGMKFNRDHSALISVDEDRNLILWNIEKGIELQRWILNASGLAAFSQRYAQFSPDGTLLAVANAGNMGQVEIWDVNSASLYTTLDGINDPGSGMSLTSDSNTLITFSNDGVFVWDVDGDHLARRLHLSGNDIINAIISPSGKRLAIVENAGTVRLWDITSGVEEAILSFVPESTYSSEFIFSPDENYLVFVNLLERTISIWNLIDPKTVELNTNRILDVIFSTDSSTLFVATVNGVSVFDVNRGEIVSNIAHNSSQEINQIKLQADGSLLAVTDYSVFNLTTGAQIASVKFPTYSIQADCRDFDVTWDDPDDCPPEGKMITIDREYDPYWSKLSASDRLLAVITMSDRQRPALQLWDMQTNTERFVFERGSTSITDVVFSPDESIIAVVYGDYWVGGAMELNRTVDLLDSASGERLATLSGFTEPVQKLVFASDGKLILTEGDTIRFWGVPE
jgi:WD40 repeat protein